MTRTQAAKQAADYRKAAAEYAAEGATRVAQCLTELADRIDARLIAGDTI